MPVITRHRFRREPICGDSPFTRYDLPPRSTIHPAPQLCVVLCTLNRAEALARCFDHLAASGAQLDAAWELVVVDNGSTDDTPNVISQWSERLPLIPLLEKRRGLSVARNAGVRAATARITAFVDDDCIVGQHWLASILAAHSAPGSAHGIGGRVRLCDPSDLPVSVRDFDDAIDVIDVQGVMHRLIGCNFTARTDALRKVGLFDERLGSGSAAQAAEDLDLFYRMLHAGYRLRYQPAIEVLHAHGRKSSEQLASLMRAYLVGRGAFYAKHALRADRVVIKNAYWEMRRLAASALPASARGTGPLSSAQMLAALAHGALLRIGRA